MIESGHKAKCLLCPKHTEITCKRYNVERHNATNHAEFMKKIISDEERKLIFDRKKAELQGIKMKKIFEQVRNSNQGKLQNLSSAASASKTIF